MKSNSVYFYCVTAGPPKQSNFQHQLICLAEGFKEIDTNYFSSCNYWQNNPEGEYLFNKSEDVGASDCDIVVLDHNWFVENQDFPKGFFDLPKRCRKVYIDSADENDSLSHYPEFRRFDFVLKAHVNRFCYYSDNVRPWAFGLSNRIISACSAGIEFNRRNQNFMATARVNHPVRKQARLRLDKLLEGLLSADETTDEMDTSDNDEVAKLLWYQTGRRHYPTYFERLKKSQACFCFGGRLASRLPFNHKRQSTIILRLLKHFDTRPPRILQWDSWRFWESLASGAVAFHVDLDKYGAVLPVMPQNLHHYVGIDFDCPEKTVSRLKAETELLESISSAGKKWALENYSPAPTAKRFLKLLQ